MPAAQDTIPTSEIQEANRETGQILVDREKTRHGPGEGDDKKKIHHRPRPTYKFSLRHPRRR